MIPLPDSKGENELANPSSIPGTEALSQELALRTARSGTKTNQEKKRAVSFTCNTHCDLSRPQKFCNKAFPQKLNVKMRQFGGALLVVVWGRRLGHIWLYSELSLALASKTTPSHV